MNFTGNGTGKVRSNGVRKGTIWKDYRIFDSDDLHNNVRKVNKCIDEY